MSEKSFHVEVVTKEKRVYEGEATYVAVPGVEGPFVVLHDHAPLVSLLNRGEILVKGGEKEERFLIAKGVAHVLKNKVSLLVDL